MQRNTNKYKRMYKFARTPLVRSSQKTARWCRVDKLLLLTTLPTAGQLI